MKRDEITRSDFPTARKGYDPAEVDAHLRAIADAVEEGSASPALADVAAESVRSIVEAAEQKAREIESDARREAEELLSNAREQARDQIERAQRSVANLVGQADELRERIGAMAEEVTGGSSARAARTGPASETPQPETVPEPGPEPVPEPGPPEPEVDPTPVTVPEPTPPREPEPEPPSIPEPSPEPPAPAANGADEQAARLVAMKMALDGASRDEVARHLADKYGLGDSGGLLDQVFERAAK